MSLIEKFIELMKEGLEIRTEFVVNDDKIITGEILIIKDGDREMHSEPMELPYSLFVLDDLPEQESGISIH